MDQTEQAQPVADDAAKALRDEGAAAERARIAAITEALPGEAFAEARASAIAGGWDIQQTKAEAFGAAIKRAEAAEAKAADLERRLSLAAAGGVTPDAREPHDDQAIAEARAAEVAAKAEPATKFAARIVELRAEGKSPFAAVAQAKDEDSDGYSAWLASVQRR